MVGCLGSTAGFAQDRRSGGRLRASALELSLVDLIEPVATEEAKENARRLRRDEEICASHLLSISGPVKVVYGRNP